MSGADGSDLPRDTVGVKAGADMKEGKADSITIEQDAAMGGRTGKPAVSPAEHPLQQAINSFDMALGELNQLVHLVDLARAGEFMALARVTPKDDELVR